MSWLILRLHGFDLVVFIVFFCSVLIVIKASLCVSLLRLCFLLHFINELKTEWKDIYYVCRSQKHTLHSPVTTLNLIQFNFPPLLLLNHEAAHVPASDVWTTETWTTERSKKRFLSTDWRKRLFLKKLHTIHNFSPFLFVFCHIKFVYLVSATLLLNSTKDEVLIFVFMHSFMI